MFPLTNPFLLPLPLTNPLLLLPLGQCIADLTLALGMLSCPCPKNRVQGALVECLPADALAHLVPRSAHPVVASQFRCPVAPARLQFLIVREPEPRVEALVEPTSGREGVIVDKHHPLWNRCRKSAEVDHDRLLEYAWSGGDARAFEPVSQFDEQKATTGVEMLNPEQLLLQKADGRVVEQAMSELPVRFREILILGELEGFSYKQIAEVMGVPMGTVMSTLSRARERFRHAAIDLLKVHGPSQIEGPTARGSTCVCR